MELQNAGPQGLKGARAFRKAVHSVLSPANREHMAEEARRADRLAQDRHKKKLVIGGKTFSINEDDLSVVDEISGIMHNYLCEIIRDVGNGWAGWANCLPRF